MERASPTEGVVTPIPTLPRTNSPLVGATILDEPMEVPPLTVKAELAVVTPIPTLPDTARPVEGAGTLVSVKPMMAFDDTDKPAPGVVMPNPTLPKTNSPLVGATILV